MADLFIDLLHSVSPDELAVELADRFGLEPADVEAHMGAFRRALTLQPTAPDFSIEVKRYIDEDGDEEIDVGGRVEGDPCGWAIEFRPWPQWLGAPITSDLPPVATVAECLFEMTFVGYDEQAIQRQWEGIVAIKDEYDEAKATGELQIIKAEE